MTQVLAGISTEGHSWTAFKTKDITIVNEAVYINSVMKNCKYSMFTAFQFLH